MNILLRIMGVFARLGARIANRQIDKKEAQEKANQRKFDAAMANAKNVHEQAEALLQQAERANADYSKNVEQVKRINEKLSH